MTELWIGLAALIVGAALGYLIASLRAARGGGADAQTRTDLALATARADALEGKVAEVTAAAQAREVSMREEHERYVAQVRADQEVLKEQFKALAADVLKSNNEQFLTAAGERFTRAQEAQAAELAKREAAVKQMVDPLAKALDDVKKQTTEADKARAEGQAALVAQVRNLLDSSERLSKETAGLKDALRRPEQRGRWGELHLRRVVEVAGLVNHVDFVEQVSATDDEGRKWRPDMLVRLAGGRTIVVDSKASVDAILDAAASDDPRDREAALDRHVANIRKRVQELNSKQYTSQFDDSLEFVILFLPAESFLQAALERDPSLQEWAYEKQGVVIATPTILVALLRTVGHAWKQAALAENAHHVLVTGKELYERLMTMGSHLAKVGKSIDGASKAYNDAVGAFERRVLPSARRMGQLQSIEAEFPATPIDTEIRAITAPELTAAEDPGPDEDELKLPIEP